MKTIKTKLTQNGANLYIKALLIGTIVGGITVVLMLCLISAIILISGTLPSDLMIWIGMIIGITSCLVCGYTSARITKINGLIIGACGGFLIFFMLFISGIIDNNAISYITLIKLLVFLTFGAIGGIKGVNKKEKLHIK